MKQGEASDFLTYFGTIQDPRLDRRKLHRLDTILFIALCAVISGVKSWVEMEEFGKARQVWFSKYVDLSNSIPSHDTFARVFSQLNPKEFEKVFLGWIQSVYQKTKGEIVSIDGKSVRRAHDKKHGLGPLHLVNAWAHTNHLVLGQVKTEGLGTEIEAIPKLLQILDVKGCIVTIDAIGCQKEIAREIQEKKADYVLALKGNQELLHEEVREYWNDPGLPAHEYDTYETVEKGHGRIEIRHYRVSDKIDWLSVRKDWRGLTSIGMVESKRIIGEQTTIQRRYYLTSLKANAKQLAKAIRSHWEVENKVHWWLDVLFQEDQSRARVKHAAQNLALLRRLSLNILRRDLNSKKSLNIRSRLAGWKTEYLETLLNGN
jgi:predicted transposase YbfD/YdcC